MSNTAARLRLVTFHCSRNNQPRVGAFMGDSGAIFDFQHHISTSNSSQNDAYNACSDMQLLINSSSSGLVASLKEMWLNAQTKRQSCIESANTVLHAPIPLPKRNIFCVGKNYLDHIAEVKAADSRKAGDSSTEKAVEIPKFAQFFTKAPDCVVAPNATVDLHANLTKWLDYEAELAVIIGKGGRDISKANAFDHVFGYSIGNDITARDIQRRHVQFFKGKTLDTTCPMGPCIVPRSELPDAVASNLSIQLWLNGELKQNSRTSNMIFKIDDIIEQLSQGFTLKPGDIILTGTPAGVAFASTPPFALKSGDSMRIEIENIGVLRNNVA